MKPAIGISQKDLSKSIELLSALLSNEAVLYTKTRKFHWNVSGESFMELHKLFQSQYTELEEIIDEVAERISKLGGQTIGTMKEFLAITKLKESPGKYLGKMELIKELLDDHQTVIIEIRKGIEQLSAGEKDAGTIDFITGVMQQHESIAWTLRRYF